MNRQMRPLRQIRPLFLGRAEVETYIFWYHGVNCMVANITIVTAMVECVGKNVFTRKNGVFWVQKLINPSLNMLVQATDSSSSRAVKMVCILVWVFLWTVVNIFATWRDGTYVLRFLCHVPIYHGFKTCQRYHDDHYMLLRCPDYSSQSFLRLWQMVLAR